MKSKLTNRKPNVPKRRHPGDHEFTVGENCRLVKLTEKKIHELRKQYQNGATIQECADRFGIAIGTAQSVIGGRTWRHLNLTNITRQPPRRGTPIKTINKIRKEYAASNQLTIALLAEKYELSTTMIFRILKGTAVKNEPMPNVYRGRQKKHD